MNPKGTGLGLYNCFNICQIVGDNLKIKIKSEINKGSNFSFQIYQNINEPFKEN